MVNPRQGRSGALLNVINREDLVRYLEILAREQFVPAGLIRQALERGLLRERSCFEVVRRYPRRAPLWLTREKFEAGAFYRFSSFKTARAAELREDIDLILYWLRRCAEDRESWLDERLADGRVVRLMNVGTIEHLAQLAKKDLLRKEARMVGQNAVFAEGRMVDRGKVETVLELAGGWRWVRLSDWPAFVQEGVLMRNCLSNRPIVDPGGMARQIYSLRDARNRPKADVEISNGIVIQCRSKANSDVPARYDEAVGQLMMAVAANKQFLVRGGTLLVERGTGDWVGRLVDEVLFRQIGGHLLIDSLSACERLPACVVLGGLRIVECSTLVELGRRIEVFGKISISGCQGLRSIGEEVSATGDVALIGLTSLREIGEGFSVGGHLKITEAFELERIGGGLRVGGNMTLMGVDRLRELPEDMEIEGNLDVQRVSIGRWPKEMKVRGHVVVGTSAAARRVPKAFRVKVCRTE